MNFFIVSFVGIFQKLFNLESSILSNTLIMEDAFGGELSLTSYSS